DDILALSKARHMASEREKVAAGDLVEEALARLADNPAFQRAELSVAPGLPVLVVNRVWVVEAVYNLVSNALKYSGEGQRAEIEIAPYRPLEHEPGREGFMVRDRGPGVPP